MSKQKFVPVTFVKPFGGYQPNDTASFTVERSAALVKGKVAIPYEPQTQEPPCQPASSRPAKTAS